MRLVVARCEVTYSGRLTPYLPEAIRLLVFKADGSVLVHADSGGYKPLNWMTPPTVIEDGDGAIVVRKRAGRSEDRLEISARRGARRVRARAGGGRGAREGRRRAAPPGGARRAADALEAGLRLVRREWPTEIGPVDLMCRDADAGWVAVEIKRVGTIEAVEQLSRYLEVIRRDPALAACRGILAAQSRQATGADALRGARARLRRGRPRAPSRRAGARVDAVQRLRSSRSAVVVTWMSSSGGQRAPRGSPSPSDAQGLTTALR